MSAGFIIPESSVEGLALSDAIVANKNSSGAFSYNYSSMLFAESDSVSVDLIGVVIDGSVSPSAPNAAIGKVDNEASNAVLPSVYFTNKISQQYSWGMHVGVPFGLETVIPANTFSSFQTIDAAIPAGGLIAGLHPTKSNIELLAISPSIGRKMADNFAIAVGLDYYELLNVEMNSVANQLSGDGNELGWNISMQYHQDQWSFGASYHSSVDMKITGEANISGTGIVTASTRLGLPDRLQIGVGYQLSDKLFIEFDVERIGWSNYDQLVLTATGGALPSGTVFSTMTNNWDDATNLRLGLSYQLSDAVELLFGTGYEQKAQGDDYFDVTIPDDSRYMISAGMVYKMPSDWQFKLGYQFAKNKDRTISGRSYMTQLINSGFNNSDANGTDVYNGQYRGVIHMFSLGATRSF